MTGTQIAIALVAAAGLAATAPGLTPGFATSSAPATGDIFPLPSGSLTIVAQGDGAHTMYDVVKELNAAGHQNFTVSQQTRSALESTSPGLLTDVVIPPAEVYTFVSSLLYRNGFLLSSLRTSQPSLLAIYSGNDRGYSWTRIPAEEVPAYGRHPAFLVETVLAFENLDVRQMTTSLRALLSDNRAQSMLTVGNSNSVIIRGPGAKVAKLAEMMKEADAANGKIRQKRAEEEVKLQPIHTCQQGQQAVQARQGD